MSEIVLAYELALRSLDSRDLESARLFLEIARTFRETVPTAKSRGRWLRRK